MTGRLIGKISFISFVFLFGLSFYSPVKAGDIDKEQAINEALLLAQAAPVDALPKSDPQTAYREKLDIVISKEKDAEEFHHQVDSFYRYMPYRSLEVQPGEIAITQAESEYAYDFKAFGQLPIEFSFSTQYFNIAEKNVAPTLPAQLTGLSAGVETTLPFFNLDNTYFRLKVMPSFYSNDWSARSSAFRIPVNSFLIYQPNDKWTFIAGTALRPDFEDVVFPIAGFIYKPDNKWTFNIIPDRPNICYAFSDRFSVFAEADMTYAEFEVNKDELKGAILKYNENHFGGGVKVKFNKYVEASLSSGYMCNRYLRYTDSQGKVDLKDDIYSEFRMEVRM